MPFAWLGRAGRPRLEIRRAVAGMHAVAAGGIATAVVLVPPVWGSPWRPAGLGAAAGLVVAHLAAFRRGRAPRQGSAVLVTVVSAVLGYLPILAAGPGWVPCSGYFAGTVLLVCPPELGAAAALLACVAAGCLGALTPGAELPTVIGAGIAAALVALTLFGLVLCTRLVLPRDDERRELEHRVVADERRRFARDIHDLLGLSLSAITLKGELVDRLVVREPERAKAELSELLVMSRKALADIRAVSAGYRELSFGDECRTAEAVLRAAGVRPVTGPAPAEPLPPAVATAFGMVLREAVTNVLRHSDADWCRIGVRTLDGVARLEVVNDGVRRFRPAKPVAGQGAGLRNLHDRVCELGGCLTAGAQPDGTHRLVASVPLAREEPDARRHAGTAQASA